MTYLKFYILKLLLFTSFLTFTVLPMPIQAIAFDTCMEDKCIVYFNKWKAMIMARAKQATAMSAVAELYYQGYGTEKNLDKSLRYFRKASRYQFAYAQYRTGVFYLMEDGFIDNQKGIKYLKKAARSGHTESAFLLGVIFGTGELGIKDVGESDKWLVKALERKHSIAQKYAGYLYKTGQVNEGHYVKVNEAIKEVQMATSNINQEKGQVTLLNAEIQWPSEHNEEIITVSAPSLDDVFDYELIHSRIAGPTINSATGSNIRGQRCDKILNCYQIDKEDFWNYAMTQSGFSAN